MAYYNQGLETDDEDEIEDDAPYTALKEPILENQESEDQELGDSPQPMDLSSQVKQSISKRSYETDPLLQDFAQEQQGLGNLRDAGQKANYLANMGQAFASFNPGAKNPIYDSIKKQNDAIVDSKAQEIDKRSKIIQAIEQRRSREGVAAENRLSRQALNKQSQDNKKDSQEISINRNMGAVVSRINADPIIKPSEQNLASLHKSRSILMNQSVPLTPQSLADAEQDIASALTLRSMGASEGKIKRTEIETIGRDIAKFKQKYLNRPGIDLRKEEPELVKQITKLNNALIDDYELTINQRKNSVLDEHAAVYGDDPRFQGRIDKLRQNFNKTPSVSAGLEQSSSSFPKQISKGDENATVFSKEQLKEAQQEGWQ